MRGIDLGPFHQRGGRSLGGYPRGANATEQSAVLLRTLEVVRRGDLWIDAASMSVNVITSGGNDSVHVACSWFTRWPRWEWFRSLVLDRGRGGPSRAGASSTP